MLQVAKLIKRIAYKQGSSLLASIFVVMLSMTGLSSSALAQMNIQITGVGQSLYPIAVMRFKDENKLPTSVTDIIRQDLARSGYFKNTENGNASELSLIHISEPTRPY